MNSRAWTALLWLDWKLLVNRIRSIRQNPRRLIPWVIFLIWLIPAFINRLVIGSHVSGRAIPVNLVPLLSASIGPLVPSLALLVLGLAIWLASNHAPAAFQSPADARFVIGAGLDSRVIFTWLSLRTARRLIVSVVLMLILLQVLYLPGLGISGGKALTFTFALATYAGIIFGARLLAFNLQRAARWLPVWQLGALLALLGTAATSASLAQTLRLVTLPQTIDTIDGGFPPGSWMLVAFGGDLTAEVALLAFAIGLTSGGIALAGDCYPELWETSSRVFAMRRAIRERGGMFGRLGTRSRPRSVKAGVRSSSAVRVPGGAWTVLWKEWLSLRRGRGGLRLQGAMLSIAVLVGVGVGLAASRGSSASIVIASNVALFTIVWSLAASVNLGHDLGSPLWWLSASPLWGRLTTWTLARALRFALPLIVFIEVTLAAYGRYAWLLGIAPLAPFLVCWLMQALGLAAYALLPARTDYRLAMTLRLFTMYAIFLPLGLSLIPGAIFHNAVMLVALPSVVVASAIVGLIAFASWRIEGNGLVFAREERQ